MTKFEELIQDAPKFFSMDRGDLVAYAYGMFAAVKKADAENAKLRELVADEENEPHECYFIWSLADNGWADHTCSKCGFVENTDIHVGLGWNYCPNCGRKVISK